MIRAALKGLKDLKQDVSERRRMTTFVRKIIIFP
jgi:hypothetical protein